VTGDGGAPAPRRRLRRRHRTTDQPEPFRSSADPGSLRPAAAAAASGPSAAAVPPTVPPGPTVVPGAPVTPDEDSALAVFRNRSFVRLWLSQAATQIGGNMVIYGLTVIVLQATGSNTAVSLLILTFLVPAVLFSAVAGVYVDRLDRRLILVVTNVLRAAAFVGMWVVQPNLPLILLLNVFVSTVTVFFAPAEAAMIPMLVPRSQLLAANGVFTFTLNAAFALGFALVGPIVVRVAGAEPLLLIVATLYVVAAGLCWTLPRGERAESKADRSIRPRRAVADAEAAVGSTVAQFREGITFIRANRTVTWSLVYLGVGASLVGVLGVLGPDFATDTLGLTPQDFVVVVLPLGFGVVMGILLLNTFGRFLPRRRVIEVGLVALGVLLAGISLAGPLTRFLQRAESVTNGILDLSSLTSLLAIIVLLGFFAGIAYACVAIPSQTQLQEDLPAEVRGRVFGVLNMLVSVASFVPIIIVGPISDLIGTTTVLLLVAIGIAGAGTISIATRGPLLASETTAHPTADFAGPVDPVGIAIRHELIDLRTDDLRPDDGLGEPSAALGAEQVRPDEGSVPPDPGA